MIKYIIVAVVILSINIKKRITVMIIYCEIMNYNNENIINNNGCEVLVVVLLKLHHCILLCSRKKKQ